MQRRFVAFSMIFVFVLAQWSLGGGKKEDNASVSFHLETAETDNPKMIFPQMANGKQRFFQRLPSINIRDIGSFSPFPSEVGDGYGVVFTMKPGAVQKLAAVTNTNEGRWLLAQVNGRIVDGVMIDKEINDGKLVIWKGVELADITALDSALPRTGQDGKKK